MKGHLWYMNTLHSALEDHDELVQMLSPNLCVVFPYKPYMSHSSQSDVESLIPLKNIFPRNSICFSAPKVVRSWTNFYEMVWHFVVTEYVGTQVTFQACSNLNCPTLYYINKT